MSLTSASATATTATFLTSLATNGIVAAVQVIAFVVLKDYFTRIYEPQTVVPPKGLRQDSLSRGPFKWFMNVVNAPVAPVIRRAGLDAFMYLRFLKLMVILFTPLWIVSWLILLPLTSVGTNGDGSGLSRFVFGNITESEDLRWIAHLILSWLFAFWVFYLVNREMTYFVNARQRYMIDKQHSLSAQAKTVLITDIPEENMNTTYLRKLFSHFPGGVAQIWLNHDLKKLPDVYEARNDAYAKLESGVTALLKTAQKMQRKHASRSEDNDAELQPLSIEKYVPFDKRPKHRLGFLGLIGKKVDTIDWAKSEIPKLEKDLQQLRDDLSSFDPSDSAFILFRSQAAAHLAAQSLCHHAPHYMSGKFTEMAPLDVVWDNVNTKINPNIQLGKMLISYAITAGLIIFWAIPVAFIGSLSNLTAVCEQYSWLAWTCKIGKIPIGLVQGVLPTVLLSLLNMALPPVLRLLAKFEGIPSKKAIELSLMSRFTIFQVIHSFLIITISSGLVAAIQDLASNPTSIPGTLASTLPKANIFFITWLMLQLTGISSNLLQIVTLLLYYAKLYLLSSTPRQTFKAISNMNHVNWGTTFPTTTILVIVSYTYTIISPIIAGFAVAVFLAFYFVYKYLFLWVYDQPSHTDTGGLFFPKAMYHIFAGLYLQQICLAGLFFLVPKIATKVLGILMIVLIIVTLLFQLSLMSKFAPLIHSLPLTLADKSYSPVNIQAIDEGKEQKSPELSASASQSPHINTKKYLDKFGVAQKINKLPGTLMRRKNVDRHEFKVNDGGGNVLRTPFKSAGDLPDVNVRDVGDNQEKLDKTAFMPPSVINAPDIVWIPADDLNLHTEIILQLREAGIESSSANTRLNKKNRVVVEGYPPEDEEANAALLRGDQN